MATHRGQRRFNVDAIVIEVRADPNVSVAARDDHPIPCHGLNKGVFVGCRDGDHRAVLTGPVWSDDGSPKLAHPGAQLIVQV